MKFLIDEDVPVKLLGFLSSRGHDAIRAASSTPDPELAKFAKTESRILVTLDKDFSNTRMFPPSQFNIVHIRLHPPFADPIIEAFKKLSNALPPAGWRGLTVLLETGHISVSG